MSVPVTLEALDLAALLCSRVCHDLISPVGAIVNGMEVLEDTSDEGTKTFALDLIKKSANQASARSRSRGSANGAAPVTRMMADSSARVASGNRWRKTRRRISRRCDRMARHSTRQR